MFEALDELSPAQTLNNSGKDAHKISYISVSLPASFQKGRLIRLYVLPGETRCKIVGAQ